MPMPSNLDPLVHESQKVYNNWQLNVYDLMAVRIFQPYVWGCPMKVFHQLYDRNMGGRHLELGVGTGLFVDRPRAAWQGAELTLVDLNQNCLDRATRRLRPRPVRARLGDIMQPMPDLAGRFDSVALNLVMHTIPGGWAAKGPAFRTAVDCLRPGGRLFGSTVLDRGVPLPWYRRRLMRYQHRQGNFQNQGDDERGLTEQLERYCEDVHVSTHGATAVFEATTPRT
jgi:SAM-dependent methyltransferase